MEKERSTTAKNLWQALEDTNVYLNHHTRDDYGFSRCTNTQEHRELMNIYRLVKESEIGPHVMHQWLLGGTLEIHLSRHLGRMGALGVEPRRWIGQHSSLFRTAGTPLPRSVWDLIKYVEGLIPEVPAAVESDYGFSNCSDDMERGRLKWFYERLLKEANPYELYDACMRNTIADYTERVLGWVNPVLAQYLRNNYPRNLDLEDWERVPVEEEEG